MSQLKKIRSDHEPRTPEEEWSRQASAFTRFVRDLEPDRPWEEESFREIWNALRRLLINELKRRSLWQLPPACLGIYGAATWADEEAVEELVADGFLFVFGERLRSLKAQLAHKPNIEGLVLRSVRNFLHEAQKRHDPVGWRVFAVLREAVRAAIADGRLHVIAGSSAMQRTTLLAFHPSFSPEETVPRGELAPEIQAWNNDLLPDLITARGMEIHSLLARIDEHLRQLPSKGIRVFLFRDLVEPLRDDVRARWRSLWTRTEGETLVAQEVEDLATTVLWTAPLRSLEERESWSNFLDCLDKGIESLPQRAKSKSYLRRLQVFLVHHATDEVEHEGAARLPSHRRLAELLGIPRERLPGLFATLQKLADACRHGWRKARR